jgi:quercetin dioxygenase-like cupin family protein
MIKAIEPKYHVEYDNSIINVYHANRGEGLPRHTHVYAHLTMCNAGSCMVRKENIEKHITKENKPINLIAGEWHEIEALEDNTVFVNIFSKDYR